MAQYRLFRPSYKDRKSGETKHSPTYHVAFRDHTGKRQTFAGDTRERDTQTIGIRLMELVRCRKSGEPIEPKLARWLDGLDDAQRARLVEMDLIDPQTVTADTPLIAQLVGVKDEAGNVTEPGYKQELEARGNTIDHVRPTVQRIKRILEGCGFTYWKELARPTAATRITVFLGELRKQDKIGAKTFNYHVRDIRGFCKWLASTGRAPAVALASLQPLNNDEEDSRIYRPLSVEEMRVLLPSVAEGPVRQGLTGEERAILYRFAFETGIRPKQIRALTVSDFNLDGNPPAVTTAAKHVKRRKTHTQELRPALAAELRKLFKSKLPTAAAIRMPSKYHMAELLRKDLADARAA